MEKDVGKKQRQIDSRGLVHYLTRAVSPAVPISLLGLVGISGIFMIGRTGALAMIMAGVGAVVSIGCLAWLLAIFRADVQDERQASTEWKRKTLSTRIDALRNNLSRSSELIDEINSELHLRHEMLEQIQAAAENNQRLAALDQEKADAVRNQIAATINIEQKKFAARSTRTQVMFFIAGLFAAVPLGAVGNVVYEWLFH